MYSSLWPSANHMCAILYKWNNIQISSERESGYKHSNTQFWVYNVHILWMWLLWQTVNIHARTFNSIIILLIKCEYFSVLFTNKTIKNSLSHFTLKIKYNRICQFNWFGDLWDLCLCEYILFGIIIQNYLRQTYERTLKSCIIFYVGINLKKKIQNICPIKYFMPNYILGVIFTSGHLQKIKNKYRQIKQNWRQ